MQTSKFLSAKRERSTKCGVNHEHSLTHCSKKHVKSNSLRIFLCDMIVDDFKLNMGCQSKLYFVIRCNMKSVRKMYRPRIILCKNILGKKFVLIIFVFTFYGSLRMAHYARCAPFALRFTFFVKNPI